MGEPLWAFLLKLLFPPLCAAFLASLVTYWLSRRRFILERWWDRKADTYAKIIGSLVALTYSLDRWVRYEEEKEFEQEGPSPRAKKEYEAVSAEYDEVQTQIERAATEGDYIISEKAANALLQLVRQLRKPPEQLYQEPTWYDFFEKLHTDLGEARNCLQTMRDEARSDLRVK